MINPFKKIESNSRWTYKDLTIIVEEANIVYVSYYYLNEWWPKQPRFVNLHKMSRLGFIFKVNKYKYI